jgi:peptide/nickel transport system permease protein
MAGEARALPLETSAASGSPLGRIWRSRTVRGIVRYPPSCAAVLFLLALVLATASASFVLQHDPNAVNLSSAFRPPALVDPRAGDLLGTDEVGRDVLMRVLVGARVSLLVGFVGATATAAIGCLVGLIAGWFRGMLGAFLMRLTDLQLAFPFLIFAITVTAILGTGLIILIVLFTVWFWGGYARLAEGMTLSLSRREFIEAERTLGAGTARILFRHLLPQLTSPVLVLWSFSFAILIIAEASLSFLGMGVPPPTASWGSMLAEGRKYLTTAWWLAVFPGLAISLTVWAINTLGDRLRDAVDRRIQI